MSKPMSFDEYKSINADRLKVIVKAIAKLVKAGQIVSVTSLTEALPKDFDLDAKLDHVGEIVAAEIGVAGNMASKEGGDGAVHDEDFLAPDDDKGETPESLRERGRRIELHVHELRSQITTLTNQRGAARDALNEAITSFNNGYGPKVSVQDNIRAELAASLATRAALARDENTAPPPVAGPSDLDRAAMWSGHQGSSSGDGRDFLRKQMRTGFRRGSMPASTKGGATRLRVPSDR